MQDRFLGQHGAIFYYWALVIVFLISPKWSYKFSEMLESAPPPSRLSAARVSHSPACYIAYATPLAWAAMLCVGCVFVLRAALTSCIRMQCVNTPV